MTRRAAEPEGLAQTVSSDNALFLQAFALCDRVKSAMLVD